MILFKAVRGVVLFTALTTTFSMPVAADNHEARGGVGKARFGEACAACHTFDDSGRHGTGPNLYGIVGARAGSRIGFEYSRDFFRRSDFVWTETRLNEWIANPEDVVHGNTMPFTGLRDGQDRAALVAYIAAAEGTD